MIYFSFAWPRGRGSVCRSKGVYYNTGEPVGLNLADRPRTFCPRANTFTLKTDWSSTQFKYKLLNTLKKHFSSENGILAVRV